MSKVRDPPTMDQFPEIYVLALNKLQAKINDEDASIRLFEQNTAQLNELLANGTSQRSIKNERQFVFKVNVVEGIYSQDPIFQLNIDTNESAEIPFSEFEEGDAMLSLPNAANNIEVTVLKENRQPAYAFNIELGQFGDKRRQIKHSAGRYNNQDVVIEYEGQVIFNQTDYHRGLQYINSQKIEESKQNKYDFTRMRDDLLDLFKDQNLRTSIVHGSANRSGDLRTSQVNLSGPTPVLRNSQLGGGFLNKEFKPADNLLGAAPAYAPASNLGGATYPSSTFKPQSGLVVNTQPNELGAYGSGFAGMKAQVSNYAHNIMPQQKLSWSPWVHILFYINIALLLVSFFVNWDRASFLSMLMAIVYLTWFLLREDYDSLLPPWFLFIGYLTAFALDLVWLIMSSRSLWNSDRYVHDGSLAGLDKFMIVMSYVIIFIEFAAAVVCAILHQRGMFTNPGDVGQKSLVPIKI